MEKLRHRGVVSWSLASSLNVAPEIFLGVGSLPSNPVWPMASPEGGAGGEGHSSTHLWLLCHPCTQRCCTPGLSDKEEVSRTIGHPLALGNHRASGAREVGGVERAQMLAVTSRR